MASAADIIVHQRTVIEGGWLTKPWIPETMISEGREFMAFKKRDREFHKFLGLDLSERSPWRNNGFSQYLQQLRNDARMASNDPMNQTCDEAPPAKKNKVDNSTVSITYPEFTFDGNTYGPHTMNVLSTTRSDAVVYFELNTENMEFISKACMACDNQVIDRKKVYMQHPLVELKSNIAKWKECRSAIHCGWQDSEGGWHIKTKTPKKSDVYETWEKNVMACEEELVEFYNDHHCEDAETMDTQ